MAPHLWLHFPRAAKILQGIRLFVPKFISTVL